MWIECNDFIKLLNAFEEKYYNEQPSSLYVDFNKDRQGSDINTITKTFKTTSAAFLYLNINKSDEVVSFKLLDEGLRNSQKFDYDSFIRFLTRFGKKYFDEVSPKISLEINFGYDHIVNQEIYDEYECLGGKIIILVINSENKLLRSLILT